MPYSTQFLSTQGDALLFLLRRVSSRVATKPIASVERDLQNTVSDDTTLKDDMAKREQERQDI